MLLIGGLLAACGQGDRTDTPPPVRPPVTVSGTSAAPARGEAVLSNPQSPPPGLVEQLKLPQAGGSDPCVQSDRFLIWADHEDEFGIPSRSTVAAPLTGEIPQFKSICVGGISPGRTAAVTLTAPSGKTIHTTSVTRPRDGTFAETPKVILRFIPGHEVGTYTITARLDGRTTIRKVTIKRTARPRMLLLSQHPDNAAIERKSIDRLRFAFGGLPPGKVTPFYLYYDASQSGNLRFHSTYRVTSNALGEALFNILVSAQTPLGSYVLTNDPSSENGTGALWHLV
ncbi:MAG TPA: hypothetical protein VFU43_03575 [Streptosporangiaceae bacterium]|nr:hypothetical protein [Streptosporangiaceae bacterium]